MTKGRKKVFILITVAVIILAVSGLVYYRIRQNLANASSQRVVTVTVNIKNPDSGKITSKLIFTGDVLPVQQANIYSRVNGNIEKIYSDIGDYVQKGKLLSRIDNSIYYQNLKQAEAQLLQTKATLENNKVNLERTKTLLDKGLSAQGDYDNAETLYRVSLAQVEALQAALNNAKIQYDYCDIRAPFSGYITKRLLDAGSYVSSNSQLASNVLFVLSDIGYLKVMINVVERDLPKLSGVTEAKIKVDSYPEENFAGSIKRMSQSIDLNSRTMPVEIDIKNRNNLLKPGMFANIELLLGEHDNATLVPIQCVLKDDKGNYIYTVSQDSLAKKIYISTGFQEDNKVEILSGVTTTDKIVFVGQELIREGMKVKIAK